MQDADGGHFAQVPESKDQVIKPERVLVLSKSMRCALAPAGSRPPGGQEPG